MRHLFSISIAVATMVITAVCASAQQRSSSPADREGVGALLNKREPMKLPPPVAEDFKPVFVVPKFKPITDAPILKREAVRDQVTGAELVLGVVIKGEARAYPINMLTGPEREIINDTLGGQPIAATWCHLCNNAVVYDRRVSGQTLTFAVSGMLWNRNLVMHDVETDSLWAHMLGEAKQGKLIGKTLAIMPGAVTTWAEWSRQHPNTTVLSMSRTATAYSAGVYADHARFVYGWMVGRRAFHIAMEALDKEPARNLVTNGKALLVSYDAGTAGAVLASREIDGRTLRFERQADGRLRDLETGSLWDAATLKAVEGSLRGKELTREPGIFAFRDAWSEFHPASEAIQ